MSLRALPGSVVALGLVVGGAVAFGAGTVGCSHDTDLSATLVRDGGADGGADADAAPAAPLGAQITVTTLAPALTWAPALAASATWAAYQIDDGPWHALTPDAPGTYSFPVAQTRWALALVCASDDDTTSTVFVHHRTSATTRAEVTLEAQCTPPPPAAEFAFTGSLSHLPATTQWLDFGYARDSRGDAIAVMGTTGTYEVVGIEPGTWDLAFGVRDDPGRAITRFVFRRSQVVTSDETLDIDVTGPGSFVPGSQVLQLHGLAMGESVSPVVYYGAGGPFGIDVGPQDVPDQTDVSLVYSTVPAASQLPADRYRGNLSAAQGSQDARTGSREITFDIHEAIALDFTFLPEPAVPAATVVGTSPYVRVETRIPVAPGAERHEVLVQASTNRRSQHSFRATYDALAVASAAEIVDTMPDLSALPGWSEAWGLPGGVNTNVVATIYEKTKALGDGTMQRTASKSVSISP